MKLRRAFTLTELLIVIGIIVILVTLTMPMLQRIRAMGKRTVCASNLRELGRAMQLYTAEHKGFFPSHKMGGVTGAPGKDRWWGRDEASEIVDDQVDMSIYPYVDEDELYHCPALTSVEVAQSGAGLRWELTPKNVGYGYNAFFLGRSDGTDTDPFPSEASIVPDTRCNIAYVNDSSLTILLADSTVRSGGSHTESYVMWWPDATTTNFMGPYTRHLETANIVTVNGSVTQARIEDVLETSSAGKELRWNPRYKP